MPSKRPEKPKSWLWFFPVIGVEVTDEDPQLKNMLFADATLLSVKSLEVMLSRLDKEDPKRISTQNALLGEKTDSILAIRRLDLTRDIEKETLLVSHRFSQVMSAITLFSLLKHGFVSAYGPSSLVSHTNVASATFCEEEIGWQASFQSPDLIKFGRRTNVCSVRS